MGMPAQEAGPFPAAGATAEGDWIDASAASIARAIRARQVSASQVVEAHLRRIEAVNLALNAVVHPTAARARAEVREADAAIARDKPTGPLHGVPITVKESLDLAGTPSTFTRRAFARRSIVMGRST